MAGIAGILAKDAKKQTVENMLEKIRHRGPDSTKIHQQSPLTAGVNASSLSDKCGDGFATDGNLAVFFDGEIYNQRSENQTDAELALQMFKKHGKSFPGYLQGVFACALFDGSQLILARGPVGVRPLYFGKTTAGQLCFASEMKALTDIAGEIQELLPETIFSSASGTAGYINRLPETNIPNDPGHTAELVRNTLTEAVKKRMADGAVGACLLSGGLDSSIIAAVAHEINPDLPMVTVGVEGGPDLENASIMAKHLGAKHETFIFDKDQIKDAVPRAVYTLESFDEDCVSGTIANLFASQTANKFTNCILSGEGGDELFGGYHLLKELPLESQRLKMMEKLVAIAFNTAVQRLDRAMMGNSINYRTPFIDTEVISTALQIPVRWKIHDNGSGQLIEKWILREAFRDMLPDKIYKRVKLRFSGGTGTDDLTDDIAEKAIEKSEFNENTRNTPAGFYLNTLKEYWYYKIFKEKFPLPDCEKLVARWDPFK